MARSEIEVDPRGWSSRTQVSISMWSIFIYFIVNVYLSKLMNWFISIIETLWQCVSVRVPLCTRSSRTCHGVDVSTSQVDQKPRSVLLLLHVDMKQACQNWWMHIGQCRTGFYYFQITPISKFGILIDKSVSFSQNKIFDVTWIFQKVQVQIRTEFGDSQPALTQSLVPVFKQCS